MAIFGWLCLLAITVLFGLVTGVLLLWRDACPGAVGRELPVFAVIAVLLIFATWWFRPFTVTLTG